MRRCPSIKLSIIHIDVKIGQKRALRRNTRNPLECKFEVSVGRMRAITHGINDKDFDPCQKSEGLFGQRHHIVRVGNLAETQAQRRNRPVVLREWHNTHAGGPKRPVNDVRTIDRIVEPVGFRLEAIAEASPKNAPSPLVRPRLDLALALSVRPQIVDTVNLVGVIVTPDYRVDFLDTCVEEFTGDRAT